jgi:diaminohydroxyphosphoribosylaminopyrimidine deaminase / 5-amino-6-(5-phosphoribosylamino)uracil reductase
MLAALALARRGLGQVSPNPAVGAVIVREGRIVGRGWTQPGGRPHAETEALRAAGSLAKGATIYVTLEPCNHHGETPPCVDALIAASVARVVSAVEDPDDRVAGQGHTRLRQAGIQVDIGVCHGAARRLNEGYFLNRRECRPLVTLKVASTLDGRIALPGGQSQWITGPAARARGHMLRATHDAILVGSGTAFTDDPSLTCRLEGLEARSPVRVVLDTNLQLPLDSQLARTARQTPVWVMTCAPPDAAHVGPLTAQGVEVVRVAAGHDNKPEIHAVLNLLADRGITRLLVEGGGVILSAFLQAGIADRVVWFRAGGVIGGDGVPALGAMGLNDMAQLERFERQDVVALGADVMEVYRRPKDDE